MANIAYPYTPMPKQAQPQQAQQQAIDFQRQQALIDALREQAGAPMDIDNRAPMNPLQGIAKLVQAYGASKGQEKLDTAKSAEMQKIKDAAATGDYSQIMAAMSGSQLPGYQELGLKSQIDMGMKDSVNQKLVEAMKVYKETGDPSMLAGVPGGLDMAVDIKKLSEADKPDIKVVGNNIYNPKTGEFTPAPTQKKPLNSTAMNIQKEGLAAINTASGIDQNLAAFEQKIAEGKLDFGPVSNITNKLKNGVGLSDEESRNYGSFMTALQKLRNDSLRLNSGVQTEGDATRAWSELMAGLNDPELVKQRLAEIRGINQKAVEFQQSLINQAREDSGADPMGFDQFKVQGSPYGAGQPAQPAPQTGGGGITEGATATNPQTGEKVIFKGGQWQPM